MPKRGRNIWVVRKGKKYSVKEEGARRTIITPVSQRDAIAIARRIAKANNSELVIQNASGRIRAKDSHGFDAYPPRG